MKIFKDRISAGKLLAKRLRQMSSDSPRGEAGRGIIVLGIPRGGVVVAKEVAQELKLPLDIIVTRKIGHPNQPELALGAVDSDGEVVGDERIINDLGLKINELREIVEKEVAEIKRREEVYRQGKEPLQVEDKVVILIDDGIATGATTLAAVRFLKRHKAKKVILAVPVASVEAKVRLSKEVDELIVLETSKYFQAVGQFYQHFEPVEDQEVIQLLK